MNLRTFVSSSIKLTGLRLIHKENYEVLNSDPRYRAGKRWVDSGAPASLKRYVFENLRYSNSQIQQDLFANWSTEIARASGLIDFQQSKYFVEFGATNGYRLSNTFYLEKYKNWQGLLCEPSRVWQETLSDVRKCSIDFRCVYSESKKSLLFTQTYDPELATLAEFRDADSHSKSRLLGDNYLVETVSLNDLLEFHQAPNFIEYLSVDTEGSEYEILKTLDFERYSFGVITVEHNYTEKRELIYELLTNKGYRRVLTEVSVQDDWYVHADLSSIYL